MNRREGCVLAVLANCSQDFWKIRDKTTVNVQATNYPFNGTTFLILHCDLLLWNFSKKFLAFPMLFDIPPCFYLRSRRRLFFYNSRL